MTPLPKRRHSTRRGGQREAAIKVKLNNLEPCPRCKALKKPHRVCPSCGFYKDLSMRKTTVAKPVAK